MSASPPSTVDRRPSTPGPAAGRLGVLRNRALATLMLGHFTVDMYVGVLPVLYPLLTEKFDLSLKTVGLVSLAYGGMASLSQPFFGWLTDRHGTRFAGLALAWTACTFAFIGFAPSFGAMLVLAALAGIGSGAYHPMGAVNARAVSPDAQRNTAMSVYVTGGTLGVASGPLVAAAIFWAFDIRGTIVMIVPGLCAAVWLLVEMRTISRRLVPAARGAQQFAPVPVAALGVVVGMMALRSWTIHGIQAYIPTWYKQLGYSAFFAGSLVTVLLVTTALGTVGSGTLADRYGRRSLLIGSSVLSVPTILLFAQFPGGAGVLTAALVGVLAASTLPLLLVIAQELMAGRAGLASGLIMGLGFTMSAIGIPITGAVADEWGIQNAMRFQALVGAATILFALALPTEARIRELTAKPAATPESTRSSAPIPTTGEAD